MPELPDLRIYSENIAKLIQNKRVSDVTIYNPSRLDTDGESVKSGLKSCGVKGVYARGKELFISFDSGNVIRIHFMLSGKCHYVSAGDAGTIQNKIMGIIFDDGNILIVEDIQNYSKISFNPKASDVPEVLSDEFTVDYFMAKAEQFKRKKIKAFLLDQTIMLGIGNAYADEILWKAKISPKSIVGKIPRLELEMLYISIKSVLMWAIEEIRKINPNMINGEERFFMQVHNPRLKFTKERERIHVETISSKKTFYTDSQVHYY